MSIERKLKQTRKRKTLRSRSKLKKNTSIPRISIFRSAKHIYGQLIDDNTSTTLASISTLTLKGLKGDKKEQAKQVGIELGKLALEKDVNSARFDRGRFLYHGRIKALAEGLREAGLKV